MLPIVVASIHDYLPYELITTMALMLVALLNGILSFYNPGKKQILHNEFEGKYKKLAAYIESQLMRHKRQRVAADVLLERADLRFDALESTAPDL